MTPSAAAVATAASTALPPFLSTSMPAAEASASTLATAPPWPTATGTFAGVVLVAGPWPGGADGGAAAPTDTTAAETASTAHFRATGRRMRTSSQEPSAQRNSVPP
ncbi:hypothetical protein GCM10018782_08100 [Streptomyces griseoaurantiacus]|nr:hypothetical protein GCM10018782_08100 [Streptomyces griseoaurantiacus]